MNSLRRIVAIMQKEILQIFRDNIAFVIAFLAPLVLTFLVGFLYSSEKVTQIPIVIYDQDQSDLSRKIIRSFGDSERFSVTQMVDNYKSMEQAIQDEEAQMALVIPPHLKQDVKEGRSSEVGVILNATNLLTMNTLANAANQVIATISGGITMKVMEGYGVTPSKAYQAVTALCFRTRYWYNPGLSYLVFMLLGLIGTIIQQVTFLGVALSFTREKEGGNWSMLRRSKLRIPEIFLGKLLVYLIIYGLDSLVVYGLAFYYFGIPMRGNIGLAFLSILLFMLALIAMGMAVSIIAQNVAQAIEISMLIAVPSFLISGYTWPQFSMPIVIRLLSEALPLTYFLKAMKGVAYMGGGLNVIMPSLTALLVFALIFIPLTAVVLSYRMSHAK
ncbi:MAG TPA: ABC transporter permease [Bacillota bacterium]|nr:ABC transporter permease [Bacillota bacterium]